MSTLPDNELDLEKLFLPAWAQAPASAKQYEKYEGGGERPERRGDRDQRGRPPGRREGGGFGDRSRPGGRPPGPGGGGPGAQRGPRREGNGARPFNRDRPTGPRRDEPREFREPLPLPEINVTFIPDETGVENLARQIKMTGRAYPLFDIARLILQKPERHSVTFSVKKKADGQIAQPLFVCALDETLWLSEDEAIAHILKVHFATFYQSERTATEPPKGNYTFVAQCGFSGVILGPPNYHDYQNQLRKLHTDRFARMPFDAFKARVKIVRDEAVVKKWIDDLSWKTEFVCLNVPEPLRLGSREAVEKHFRETHKETIIKQVESQRLGGVAARALRSNGLTRLLRQAWEDQQHFPLQIATVLSQQFASHGLQFFKVNKTVTHVSVARPHFLDLAVTPVSESIKRIVEHINAKPKTTRRKLMEALAPTPVRTIIPIAVEPPAAVEAPVAGAEAAPTPAPAKPAADEPTPEQTAVISDLHWLIHQGHVIEFANGIIETAKKPLPKPVKAPKPAAKPAEQATEAAPTTEATSEVPDLSGEQPASAEPAAASSEPESSAVESSSENPPTETPAPVEHQVATPATAEPQV
jgi:hypothetical protein